MKMFIRVVFSIFTWIVYNMIFIPLCLLGWVLIPIAAACRAYRIDVKMVGDNKSTGVQKNIVHFTWPFMWVWDNYEDGIANDTYKFYPDMFRKIVYWSCVRNPVNNLRIAPLISVDIDPKKVKYVGTFGASDTAPKNINEVWYRAKLEQYDTKVPHWFYAWHGLYSNFYWQFKLFGKIRRFWIGWKIFPTDIYGVTEYRKYGAGCALQFKVVK